MAFGCVIFIGSLLLSLFLSVTCQPCPPINSPCTCTSSIYEPIVIICENAISLDAALLGLAGLQNMPINSLMITNTSISTLPDSAFRGLTVNHLVLNKNGLKQISENAFEGLQESLTELDLKDNLLGEVPSIGLKPLKRLRTLILSRNSINSLQSNAFASFESGEYLSKVDLSGNKLESVPVAIFAGLHNLEEISFETNQLTTVPLAAFSDLQKERLKNLNLGLNRIRNVPAGELNFPNLESLSLEFNGIVGFTPDAFRNVPKLLYLYITGNKFPSWDSIMFRYLSNLRILGIGETPIQKIPGNAFQFVPNLVRLEMSEAAVDTIENGVFQRVPNIQAIIINKNRLSRIRADMFQGLSKLYTLDLSGNALSQLDDRCLANLAGLRHVDISSNNLETAPENIFANTFLPTNTDTRVLYLCDNPWVCDDRLEWLRRWLRQNIDIVIDKTLACMGVCKAPNDLDNWPLRRENPPRVSTQASFPLPPLQNEGVVPTNIGWIILAVILAILLASIFLLAVARYFVSRRRKKDKDDEDKIISSGSGSGYQVPALTGRSMYQGYGHGYLTSAVELDLPPAMTLYEKRSIAAVPYWGSY